MKKRIIIIEGIDGCGKDFVRDLIKGSIGSGTIKTLREPDGFFREILKNKKLRESKELGPLEEYMTMWIGRFLVWDAEILKDPNDTYIINRSFPSTYAYQIEGQGYTQFEADFKFWKKRLLELYGPENYEIIHLYLRVDLKIALERIGMRNDSDGLEHFEERGLLERTRMGYNKYFGDQSNFDSHEKVCVINANLSKDEVSKQVKSVLGLAE